MAEPSDTSPMPESPVSTDAVRALQDAAERFWGIRSDLPPQRPHAPQPLSRLGVPPWDEDASFLQGAEVLHADVAEYARDTFDTARPSSKGGRTP